jgi:hypothetical protein
LENKINRKGELIKMENNQEEKVEQVLPTHKWIIVNDLNRELSPIGYGFQSPIYKPAKFPVDIIGQLLNVSKVTAMFEVYETDETLKVKLDNSNFRKPFEEIWSEQFPETPFPWDKSVDSVDSRQQGQTEDELTADQLLAEQEQKAAEQLLAEQEQKAADQLLVEQEQKAAGIQLSQDPITAIDVASKIYIDTQITAGGSEQTGNGLQSEGSKEVEPKVTDAVDGDIIPDGKTVEPGTTDANKDVAASSEKTVETTQATDTGKQQGKQVTSNQQQHRKQR